MISELVELVERRDQLLWALHLEKGRYVSLYIKFNIRHYLGGFYVI